jgi:methylenetetrahydrofolate reductase (NADPH)
MPERRFDALHDSARETADRLRRRPGTNVRAIFSPPRVSFEFFPPKGDRAEENFMRTADRLGRLSPAFVSVTYGAGGTTRDRTERILGRLVDEAGLPAAGHITCVGATRDEVDAVVRRYLERGVRRIVALRGDPPGSQEKFRPWPGGYLHSADLVSGLRRFTDCDISVACYPEVHPDARSPQADLDHLKAKIDAGANRAITQFFFEADCFLRFRDRAVAAGVNVPIVPGILPVTNFEKVCQFAKGCGATIPAWLGSLFEGLEDDPEIRQLVSATVTAELCTRLVDHGVNEFHFYTLNRAELTVAICHVLGIAQLSRAPVHEPLANTNVNANAT